MTRSILAAAVLVLAGLVAWFVSAGSEGEPARRIAEPPEVEAASRRPGAPVVAPEVADLPRAAIDGEARESVEAEGGEAEARVLEPLGEALPALVLVPLYGVLLDAATGAPIEGFAVRLWQDSPRAGGVEDSESTTDAAGRFSFGGLDPDLVAILEHFPAEEGPLAVTWKLSPERVLPGATAPDRPAVIEAREPTLRIEARLVLPEGLSPVSRSVALARRRGAAGEWALLASEPLDRGPVPRALFAVHDVDPTRDELLLHLPFPIGEWIAEPLRLEPPLRSGSWTLELSRAGSILVRVVDEEGAPVHGAGVSLRDLSSPSYHRIFAADENGTVRFDGLHGGPWRLQANPPRAALGQFVEQRVELASGENREVLLRLEETGEPRLVAGGTVVDEEGEPLAHVWVAIQPAGGASTSVPTDPLGRFEAFDSHPCPKVTVTVGGGPSDDRFHPSRAEVACGTDGLRFQRVEVLEEHTITFRIVDARTGETIPANEGDAMLALFTPPGPDGAVERYELFGFEDGLAQTWPKPAPGLRWAANVLGWQRAEGKVDRKLFERDQAVVTVPLRRGFLRELILREPLEGLPIASATLETPAGEVLATTDLTGRARLDLAEWPELDLTIRLEGRVLDTWRAGYPWFSWRDDLWIR